MDKTISKKIPEIMIDLSKDATELFYAESLNDISFELESNSFIDGIADDIRISLGFPPLFKEPDSFDEGWYTFIINVDLENHKVNYLDCVVEVSDSYIEECPDCGTVYNLLDYVTIDGLWEAFTAAIAKEGYTMEELKENVINELSY